MDHEFHLPILESDFPEPPPIDPSLNAPIHRHRHDDLGPISVSGSGSGSGSGSQLNNYEGSILGLPHDALILGVPEGMEVEGGGEEDGRGGDERVQAVAAQLQFAAQGDMEGTDGYQAEGTDTGGGDGDGDGAYMGQGEGDDHDSGLGIRKREYMKRDGASGLTVAEKKERQRNQNRRAAEKSRGKRKDDLLELEITVESLQEENRKLQEKLQALRSNPSHIQPIEYSGSLSNPILQPTTQQVTPSQDEIQPLPDLGIDYAYIVKLQKELTSSKTTLLDRLLEIARLEGKENMLMSETRIELLRVNSILSSLKAEWGGLGSVLEMLKAEREGLGKNEEVVAREIEKKRFGGESVLGIGVGGIGVGGIGVGVGVGGGGVGGVDGEVEEMGRLVDAASNCWPA